MDEAIRRLVRNVAQGTVEACTDRLRQAGYFVNREMARDLDAIKLQIADEMVEATMECADESPDSEVHAVRALAGAR